MAIRESELSTLNTISTSDYVRSVSDGKSTKAKVTALAKTVIENYMGSKLAGSEQSVKSVIDTLDERVSSLDESSETFAEEISSAKERLTAVEGEADALDARITSLATLTEGSTTGDAELIDARTVGAKTYASLHQAIDTEFANVKSELNVCQLNTFDKVSDNEMSWQRKRMPFSDFSFGYISAATGIPSDSKLRYYYTTDYVEDGTVVINTDTTNVAIGFALYNADGTFIDASFNRNDENFITIPQLGKYRLLFHVPNHEYDATTQQIAFDMLSKVLVLEPSATLAQDNLLSTANLGIKPSALSVPPFVGLKWDYSTINSSGVIEFTDKRLVSNKVVCPKLTKLHYSGQTSNSDGVPYVVLMAQYSEETLLSRNVLYNNGVYTDVITSESCTHIRYCFGYSLDAVASMTIERIKDFGISAEDISGILPDVTGVAWTRHQITDQGVIIGSDSRILSNNIPCGDGVKITFTGLTVDENGVSRFAMVAQFDNAGNFISRTHLYGTGAGQDLSVVTDPNCTSVRFLYGYLTSSGVTAGTEIAPDFSITASKFEGLAGVYNKSIRIPIRRPKGLSTILGLHSKFTGTQPTLTFETPLYISPTYDVGDKDLCFQSFRIPPALKKDLIIINMTIASESTLTIENSTLSDELVAPKTQNGVLMNAHLGFRQMCPENTRASVDMAGKLGYRSCIVVPKITADGVFVCCHDDTINSTARNDDGTTISETLYVSDLTYDELLDYDFGLVRNSYWKGERILLFEDFLTICSLYGMIPTISIHPTFTSAQYEEMKSMLIKKGLLDVFHVKFWNSDSLLFGVFGNEIGEYTFINYSIADINQAKTSLGIQTKITFESDSRAWYTSANIASYVNAGIPVVLTTTTSYDTTGSLMETMLDYGITQVTDDTFCNNGLLWLP